MATASPFDLGARVSPTVLQVGKTYCYRNTSLFNAYEKKVLVEIRTNPGGPTMAFLRNDNGGPVFSVPIIYSDGQPSFFHEFYDINPKPVQRAIGEVFVRKTPSISSGPGTVANLVRQYVGVQPPKVPVVGRKNSRRYRRNRKNRSSRKNNRRI
jgi:hypothetical protein